MPERLQPMRLLPALVCVVWKQWSFQPADLSTTPCKAGEFARVPQIAAGLEKSGCRLDVLRCQRLGSALLVYWVCAVNQDDKEAVDKCGEWIGVNS
jgi:hypothetical protein